MQEAVGERQEAVERDALRDGEPVEERRRSSDGDEPAEPAADHRLGKPTTQRAARALRDLLVRYHRAPFVDRWHGRQARPGACRRPTADRGALRRGVHPLPRAAHRTIAARGVRRNDRRLGTVPLRGSAGGLADHARAAAGRGRLPVRRHLGALGRLLVHEDRDLRLRARRTGGRLLPALPVPRASSRDVHDGPLPRGRADRFRGRLRRCHDRPAAPRECQPRASYRTLEHAVPVALPGGLLPVRAVHRGDVPGVGGVVPRLRPRPSLGAGAPLRRPRRPGPRPGSAPCRAAGLGGVPRAARGAGLRPASDLPRVGRGGTEHCRHARPGGRVPRLWCGGASPHRRDAIRRAVTLGRDRFSSSVGGRGSGRHVGGRAWGRDRGPQPGRPARIGGAPARRHPSHARDLFALCVAAAVAGRDAHPADAADLDHALRPRPLPGLRRGRPAHRATAGCARYF